LGVLRAKIMSVSLLKEEGEGILVAMSDVLSTVGDGRFNMTQQRHSVPAYSAFDAYLVARAVGAGLRPTLGLRSGYDV
jgi:hypothetical protein